MDDQNQNIPVQPEEQKERIDELDLIGGGIIKVIMQGISKLKSYFSPQKPV